MCALLSLTATSHSLQEKKKTGKAAAVKKEEVKAQAKEEVKKEPPQSKAEGKKADKKAEGKKAEGKKAEGKKAEGKKAEGKGRRQEKKAEGKKAEGKKAAAATVVCPCPWMRMATQWTQRRARSPWSRKIRERSANAPNVVDVGILHVHYRILCRILNTMKNTVFFCVFCTVLRGILDWCSEVLRILCEFLEKYQCDAVF